jgi:hypothetical protein
MLFDGIGDPGDLKKSFDLKLSLQAGTTRYVRMQTYRQGEYLRWRLVDEEGHGAALTACRYQQNLDPESASAR